MTTPTTTQSHQSTRSAADAALVLHGALNTPRPLEVTAVHDVSSHIFNRLAAGELSACVMPQDVPTKPGAAIVINNAQDGRQLLMQTGQHLSSEREVSLEKGYKAVEVSLPGTLPQVGIRDERPALAFAQSMMAKSNTAIIPQGAGHYLLSDNRHYRPLLDRDTILIDGKPLQAAVVVPSEMPGIARGYMLVTPPQRRLPGLGG